MQFLVVFMMPSFLTRQSFTEPYESFDSHPINCFAQLEHADKESNLKLVANHFLHLTLIVNLRN